MGAVTVVVEAGQCCERLDNEASLTVLAATSSVATSCHFKSLPRLVSGDFGNLYDACKGILEAYKCIKGLQMT